MKTLYRSFSLAAILLTTITMVRANDCTTAQLIISQENFSASELNGTLSGAGFSGEAQCTGPDGRDDRWYRFVAVGTKHGVRAIGAGDLFPSIEVYSACGGEVIACHTGTGNVSVLPLSGLTQGETYYYRVYDGSEEGATDTEFATSVMHIPFVKLQAQHCGVMDFNSNDIIRATLPSNTMNFTNYQFRFVELEAPFNTYIITSPNGTNPNFRLKWFPQLEYGRTYEVSVRVRAIVPAFGDFGESCVIGMQPQVLSTQLEEQYANGFFGFCDWVGAQGVGLATKYRWRFLDISSATTSVAYGDNNQRLLRLSSVPNLKLGATYLVTAYATVAGEESPDGPFRFLNMNNFVPNTGIRQDIYTCGETYPISSDLQAREICHAESYTWRFRNTTESQPDLLYTRTDGNRFIKLNWVAGLNVGHSYDVDVKASQGGLEGDYSSICNITIGASLNPNLLIADDYFLSLEEDYITNPAISLPREFQPVEKPAEWAMTALPEVGGSSYSVVISGGDYFETIEVEVYDLNGRLVGRKQLAAAPGAEDSWTLNELTRGVYVVRAVGDMHFETRKITVF